MGKSSILTDKNFKEEVLDSGIPVLVDFWASWCPPCKIMEPVIEFLTETYGEKIKIKKINVDQNSLTASRYEIKGVPTFLIFKDGKTVSSLVGAHSKEQLCSWLSNCNIL